MISRLNWDSEFFGFNTGRATYRDVAGMGLQDIMHLISTSQYRLVYFLVPGLHLQPVDHKALAFQEMMQQSNVLLADQKVIYTKKANPCLKNFVHENISPINTIPVPERLQALALQAGHHSRFHIDPRFPDHLFVRLYMEWLLKSLTGEMADEVLVWLDQYRIIQGFITVKHHSGYSDISLIAVDESARGQKVGTHLIRAAEASCVRVGNNRIDVATQQNNIPACRFYENYGFQLKSITAIYHWWQ